MAKTFLISTTGAGTVTLNDLGARAFTHPVTNYDLTAEYSLEEIRESLDLRAAINAGDLTATFDGISITTNALFDEYMVDFDHVQVADHETRITDIEADVLALQNGGRRFKKAIAYVDNTAVPPTEVNGARYILDDTGVSNAAWDGAAALSIVTFNSTSGLWEEIVPLEGDVLYVDALGYDANFVDDGAPYWEFRNGLLEQSADQVPYTPTTPADWDVAPTEVEGALDELASRVEDLENAPPTIKKSFTYSAGENGKLNGSRDIRRSGDITTNITPFVVPIAATIWGISIASKQGTNVSFQVQVILNGSAVITKTVTTADKLVSSTETQALVAGDEIRLRFIKTTDNIEDLGVELYCIES
jgi:hypothetical protein